MKQYIGRVLIDYCCKKALSYELRKEMLKAHQRRVDYVYAIGSNIERRDRWLNIVEKIQGWILN